MDETRRALRDFRRAADQAVDNCVRSTSVFVRDAVLEASGLAVRCGAKTSEVWEDGKQFAKNLDAQLFAKLKDGVNVALSNPNESFAAGAAVILLGFPGSRSFLYNAIFRRFRSEESIFRSGQRRADSIKAALETAAGEAAGLSQEKATALQQVKDGMAKLRSASGRLQALGSTVSAAEREAEELIQELRRLSGPDALRLRMEVAEFKAGLGKQRRGIEKDYNHLLRRAMV
mmetsp:Transcript_10911/g.25915  ORF Transcript_10911/g.25915 Transcript_10911/m.25915 type:complete len:231 (+) Transcript_10911:84-776(+)